MKKLAILAAFAAVAALATPAAAQSWQQGQAYVGVGYTHFNFEDDEVGGVTGRLGYRFHPNFAVEGEGTMGVSDGDNLELNSALGVYGVGIMPVSESVDLFGRVGYQTVDAERAIGPDIDSDGLGYGVGANLRVSDRFGIRGDYTRLDGGDDGEDADTFSISGTLSF